MRSSPVFFLLLSTWLLVAIVRVARAKPTNEVVSINTKFYQNAPRHHTEKYQRLDGRSLVLRRGEIFEIEAQLRRNFNITEDKLRIEFAFGPNPQLNKNTLIYLPIEKNLTESRWSARISQSSANRVTIQINLPPSVAIGVWNLRITAKLDGTKQLSTYHCNENLYMIFNPWCKSDQVYMARPEARDEYTLNEVGIIYIGSYNRPSGRRWTYGQFDSAVLPAVMYLLDRSGLNMRTRTDVVQISRAVSALVNSHDENGLLVGNWSGSYRDGLAPWQWDASPIIFRRYIQSGYRSVKFGQCWVFGGVATTALRTLGIPARTISNFVSAHDTDASLTVDKFYSEGGAQLDGVNGDSIWNFHVWSDAWMARHDLPPGYGGWQAIDSTPQEKSMDKYQLGPASLEAIKQGKVNYAYDAGFVYAEVDADLVNWHLDPSARFSWRRTHSRGSHMGRRILTKRIGSSAVNDWEDIIDQYKYPDGSRERRVAREEAIKRHGLSPTFQ